MKILSWRAAGCNTHVMWVSNMYRLGRTALSVSASGQSINWWTLHGFNMIQPHPQSTLAITSVGYLSPLFVRDSCCLTIIADICQYSWQFLLSVNCKPANVRYNKSQEKLLHIHTRDHTGDVHSSMRVYIYIYIFCVWGGASLCVCAHTCIQYIYSYSML